MVGLPPHRPVPFDAEPRQILVDGGLEFRPAACLVDILDPQQEAPERGARHVEIE